MYFEEGVLVEAPGTALAQPAVNGPARVMLLLATAITIFFGFFPGPLLDVLADALPF